MMEVALINYFLVLLKGEFANFFSLADLMPLSMTLFGLDCFVKYEKRGYRPFLMPKSAKNSHFSV